MMRDQSAVIPGRHLWWQGVVLFCWALLVIVGPSRIAGAANLSGGGPAFSDPQDTQEMPAEWLETRISHENADLIISLDQHLYPALLPLINAFARTRAIKVAVDKGTCGITAGKLEKKRVDIGGFCCPPGKTDRLPGIRFHTLGIAPLALLVHPDNPIDNLTLVEARQIFAGNIKRWTEIPAYRQSSGPDLLIMPVVRLHCKQRPGHWRLLLDNENMFGHRVREVGAIVDMITMVAANVTAIGYEVPWMLTEYKDHGKVRMVRLDGLAPLDRQGLVAGRYPLYRVYNITTWDDGGPDEQLAGELVDYLLQRAEEIDSRYGILPMQELRKSGWIFSQNEMIGEPR